MAERHKEYKKCRKMIKTWLKKGRARAEELPGAEKFIRNLEANHYVIFDGSELFVDEFTGVTVPLMVLCGTGFVNRVESKEGYIYLPNPASKFFFTDILPSPPP